MRTKNAITLTIALALGAVTGLRADITIVNPAGANHTPSSICPALDGGNKLDPDPVQHLPPPEAGKGALAELANTNNSNFSGWTFQAGAALNGTLTIEYYHSKFLTDHYSGSEIKVSYAPATNDPVTRRFVQMIDTTDPARDTNRHRTATSPYIDPYPGDDGDDPKTDPQSPFYYTEKETKGYGQNYFYDFPRRSHPPTSYVTWRGSLYLTSWDGKSPGTVTVHDGIRYGFDAGCADPFLATITPNSTPTTTADTVTITWSTNVPSGQVQSSTNLSDWTTLTNVPAISNGLFTSVLPVSPHLEFFRVSGINTNPPAVPQPASVSHPPRTQTVEQGHDAYFSIKTDGDSPKTYQWYCNGAPITDATNRDLEFPHVQFTNQGAYYAAVTNAAGGDVSALAQLTVVQDTNNPTLVSAVASSNRLQITVTFSEGVTPLTALNPGSYQVQQLNPPGSTVIIMNAAQGADESIVVLTSLGGLNPNSQFLLHVSNVSDFATPPNFIVPASSTTFTTGP